MSMGYDTEKAQIPNKMVFFFIYLKWIFFASLLGL